MRKYFALLLCGLALTSNAKAENTGPTLDSTFSTPSNMTDQQMWDSQNFVHQGRRERMIKEGCEEKFGKEGCDPYGAEPKGLSGALEQHIGKAYTMVFGGLSFMSGQGGPSLKLKGPKGNESKSTNAQTTQEGTQGGKPEQKKGADICMYGAMGWEFIAGHIQNSKQEEAMRESQGLNDLQLAPLVNLRETHLARAETARYQRTAYQAVTACYVAQMFRVNLNLKENWQYYAKMGGALLLSVLYNQKVQKHEGAAKAVDSVIATLPGVGDCNPWTGTACFCKEPSSKDKYPHQYQEVCVLKDGQPHETRVAMGCGAMVEGKVQFDKECKCKQNNSCFNVRLPRLNTKFEVGKNFMSQAQRGFDMLSTGESDHAKLDRYSTSTDAMVGKVKDKFRLKNGPKVKLSAEQKELAEELKAHLPGDLAAIAASAPMGDSPVGLGIGPSSKATLAEVPKEAKEKLAEKIKTNYKSGGGGFGSVAAAVQEEFAMPSFGKPTEAANGTEVISFAEKAISNADVSNAPETPIFDIISNRYRRSGWGKLRPLE